MATAKRSLAPKRRLWPHVLLAALALSVAWGWLNREQIRGNAAAGAAFGAHTACSCRYVAGRDLAGCKKDFEPGMGLVFLSDDKEDKSVTAFVPFIASDTATFREGHGCLLRPWEG
jgi:hypothetical protein